MEIVAALVFSVLGFVIISFVSGFIGGAVAYWLLNNGLLTKVKSAD